MQRLLALILAVLPAGAAAQAQDPLCADLQRAMATMAEPRSYTPGWHAPAYALFAQCRARREGFEDEITCSWPLPAPEPAAAPLAARVQHCLPAARRLPEAAGNSVRFLHDFRIITVGQQGNEARLTVAIVEG